VRKGTPSIGDLEAGHYMAPMCPLRVRGGETGLGLERILWGQLPWAR
jgi:hypothetical protein